jgi:F-type H+-transporting ATPase subunit delta
MHDSKIVRNYSTSLFKVATEAKVAKQASQQLEILNSLLESDAKFQEVMFSPIIPAADKRRIIGALSKNLKIEAVVTRFLHILINKARFKFLPQISKAFSEIFADSMGIKTVRVTAANKLDKTALAELKSFLDRVLSGETQVVLSEDKSLIGGMVITYGGNLLDCSLKGAIERIEKVAKSANI